MPSSVSGSIRRGQLIVPFGVGSMVTVFGGTTLVISGLDYWFKELPSNNSLATDTDEFKIKEWRLEKLLGVDYFLTPPDYRKRTRINKDQPNLNLTIPAFRFPKWHFCPWCKKLIKLDPLAKGSKGNIKCTNCEKKKRTNFLFQVPFVSICSNGHLNEFPWNEWVHHSPQPPNHEDDLKLNASGRNATLAGYRVKCTACGVSRSLSGILYFRESDTESYSALKDEMSREDDETYHCPGERPWLGPNIYDKCNSLVVGSLRSSMNVYYSDVRSSIYVPVSREKTIDELIALIDDSGSIQATFESFTQLGAKLSIYVQYLRKNHSKKFYRHSDENIRRAIKLLLNREDTKHNKDVLEEQGIDKKDEEFRREEFNVLRDEVDYELLKTKVVQSESYKGNIINTYFSRVVLIRKLRETRALVGISRIYPNPDLSIKEKIEMLWKVPPKNLQSQTIDNDDSQDSDLWLPASTVFGEGIFIEFDEKILQEWEQKKNVRTRVEGFIQNIMLSNPKYDIDFISPRFLMIHTFSHMVISRLTHECGYSSASLKERLYIADNQENPMAGVLIYTADGDSDGTLGGLVRMGKPGKLEEIIRNAIQDAMWCSSDPVCFELGETGQGPGGMNMAACHSCCLVPETACEKFNRFLDRGVLVDGLTSKGTGFFGNLSSNV
jgi:hypothetical protein